MRVRSRVICALLLSVVTGIFVGTASAKPGKGAGTVEAKAKTLRDRGVTALAARDFENAYNALAESYRLYPEPATLYQLGQLAWNSGRTVAAQDLMRRFVADPASGADQTASREAERILEQPRAPSGDVTLVGERGSVVLVDDRVVGALPLPLPLLVPSGDHKITLEVADRRLEGRVKVLPGRTSELRFNLTSDAVVARIVPAVIWLPSFRGVPPATQKTLTRVVEQSVQKQRLSVVQRSIALAQAPRLADCLDTLLCLDQLAAANEADYVFVSTLEAAGDLLKGDWTISLSLVESATGDFAAKREQKCAGCNNDQASAALETALSQLLQEGLSRPRGTMEVLSDPPGADVLLTERKLGQTPYSRAAWTGSYDVVVKAAGYRLSRNTVVVEDGKKAMLRVTLTSEDAPPVVAKPQPPPPPPPVVVAKPLPPPPPPAPPRRPLWRLLAGGGAIAVGVTLTAFGASALVQDGRCGATCDTRFDTRLPGIGLLAAGSVLTVGGIVLMALPPSRPKGRLEARLGNTSLGRD